MIFLEFLLLQTGRRYLIIIFFSATLNQLIKYGPEELNITAVVDRQVRIETSVDAVIARVDHMTSPPVDMHSRFESVNSAITEQLNKLTSICDQFSAASPLTSSTHSLLLFRKLVIGQRILLCLA